MSGAPQQQRSLLWEYDKAIRDSDLPGLAKLVAWALRSRADVFGWSRPSLPRIAADAGISRSSVATQLNLLSERGWIYRERGGGHASTHYLLLLPVPVADARSTAGGRRASGAATPAVQLVDVSRPDAGREVDQEADQLEQFNQEEQAKRAARSVGASVVRKKIAQSLASTDGAQ